MLKALFKHYVMDIGLTAMFDNMVVNFAIGRKHLYDTYSPHINKRVVLILTATCAEHRNLNNDTISGILVDVSDDCLKIKLSNISAEEMGWEGHIYIYNEDIYKLYV